MSAVSIAVRGELRRRRGTPVLIGVVVLLAAFAATVGVHLLVESNDPYDRAFADQRGAQLVALFDASKVTQQDLRGTQSLVGADGAGGPWPETSAAFRHGSAKYQVEVTGRDDPGGDVAQLRITDGRWPQGAHEIAVTRSFAQLNGLRLGDTLAPLGVPDTGEYRIVGEVVDVQEGPASSATQWTWVPADQLSQLVGPQGSSWEMAYRFGSSDPGLATSAISKLHGDLGAGALTLTLTYSEVRSVVDSTNTLILTFLVAFSIAALVAAVVVVANSVAGVALAARRDIGIMKAVGYTPRQVVRVLVGQSLVPALIGSLVGVPLGVVVAQRLVDRTATSIGLPAAGLPPVWIDVLVLAAVLVVTAVSSAIPALGAARTTVVAAIARGPARQAGRSSVIASALARLPLPLSWSLGLQDAALRPFRSGRTVVVLLLGVASMVLAYGLTGSFDAFARDSSPDSTYAVQVDRFGDYPDAQLTSYLQSQPETKTVVGLTSFRMTVPGLSEPVDANAYRGDAQQLGFVLLSGSWYSAPGDVVVQEGFLRDANLHVGDTFTAQVNGSPVQLRITGEDFGVINGGHVVRTDWSTYESLKTGAAPAAYLVKLQPGSDAQAFADRVEATDTHRISAEVNTSDLSGPLGPARQVVYALALVLALIAVVGVVNTMLFNTRERAPDLATLKAIGMAPGRLITMVLVSAGVLGLIAGLLGIPVGLRLHFGVLTRLGDSLGTGIPAVAYDAFHSPAILAGLALAGVGLALLGALLPARGAARTAVVTTLQAE